MAFTTEEFKQLTLRGVRDPEYRLECLRDDWTQTSNPLCAWEAIKICATNKLPIPEWVTDYLAGAADRMLSAETAESKDARAVLPKILGFPSKRGPGNPLRLDAGCSRRGLRRQSGGGRTRRYSRNARQVGRRFGATRFRSNNSAWKRCVTAPASSPACT
jgi:hypothetical protein